MNSQESGIKDNYLRGKVFEFLKNKIDPNSRLSIITAYFTIYAYHNLQTKLDSIEHLNLLFGEPSFIKHTQKEEDHQLSFRIENDDIQLTTILEQNRIARECAEWIQEKVDVRSLIKSNLLHGKMYHCISSNGINNALIGSSNFTCSGLGLSFNTNIELNLVLSDRRDIQDLKDWFDEIWDNKDIVCDVKADVLRYLEQLYQHNSPGFVYYKTLYHIFEDFLADRESDELKDREKLIIDTQIWDFLFEFQKDGAKGAINKLLHYNGCILADSVGLGKTYEALAVIKYFELLNYRVLVLCPKKLRDNWIQFQASVNSVLNPFIEDRFQYTVLSHTDLSRYEGMSGNVDLATFNWGNYDLIVIDESHNFRNATPDKRDENGKVRKSRYNRLMEDVIKGNVKSKVLLLSATPVNNTLKDLRNQIYFITEKEDKIYHTTLGISSIDTALRVAQREFSNWAKRDGDSRDKADLLNALPSSFFRLLDALTIARSRNHVKRYYSETLKQLGGFPKRAKPVSLYSDIDVNDEFPSYDELNIRISKYGLSLYNPSKYVCPEYINLYELDQVKHFSQQQRESFLIGMMKVNFLKRLESSVHSFTLTMERTLEKIESTIQKIDDFNKYLSQQIEVDTLVMDVEAEDAEEDEELAEAFSVGKKLRFKLKHMDVKRWRKDLEEDRNEIKELYDLARIIDISRDKKFDVLKQKIKQKITNPTTNKLGKTCRKVIVFTAFSDTADYLYEGLKNWCTEEQGVHIGLVTGGKGCKTTLGKSDFSHLLINFSPISHQRHLLINLPQDKEIDILITTDCVSEGQNLQDCDFIINYDIHWNPVRIIQRFGRIDRIGSHHKEIQLVNFWPTEDLDHYINLKNRVESRMALVDITATGEDNLLKQNIRDLIKKDLKFRDRQLLRLREEVLDLEDFNETVTLSEFTLEDFRLELLRYLELAKEKLAKAPLGLNAIVPTDTNYPSIRPGVIFCLRKMSAKNSKDKQTAAGVNPLQPYYLVYILEDGNVRYSFTHAKQVLDIFRSTCAGKMAPYEDLCAIFDKETQQGQDMEKYVKLLKSAAKATKEIYSRKSANALGSNRQAEIAPIKDQVQGESDLELISWLVIREN